MPRAVLKKIPNTLTFLNMILGLTAIAVIMRVETPQAVFIAAALIAVGGLVDFLDGYVARRLNAVSDFGKQLDSFADLLTFGVAPVMLLHHIAVHEQSLLITMVTFAFPLAGIYRLARYNTNDFTDHFMGLPITVAGVLLATFVAGHTLWAPYLNHILCIAITTTFVLVLSALMVARFTVRRLPLSLSFGSSSGNSSSDAVACQPSCNCPSCATSL